MRKIIGLLLGSMMLLSVVGCGSEVGKDDLKSYPVVNAGFNEAMDEVAEYAWDTYFFGASVGMNENASEGETSMEVISNATGGFVSMWQVLPLKDQAFREKFNAQSDALRLMEEDGQEVIMHGDAMNMSVDFFVSEDAFVEDTVGLRLYVEAENENGVKSTIGESGIEDVTKGEWFTLSTMPSGNDGMVPEDAVLIVVSIQMDLPDEGYILVDHVRVTE